MSQIISNSDRDTYLRAGQQGQKVYMSVYNPATVWEGTVQTGGFPTGLIRAATTTSGALSDILEGYTVSVYTSGGDYKGFIRCRLAETITGFINIMEIGKGYLDLVSGDVLKATPWRRPIARFHRYNTATTFFDADYNIPVGDKHNDIGPFARTGPPAIGFRDSITGKTPLKFVGEQSETYTVGGALDAALWTWPESNTSTNLGTSGSPETVVFDDPYPDGAEYSLSVTDDAGAEHTRYGVLWTHDRTGPNAPYSVYQADVSARLGQGGRCQAFLTGDHPESEIPIGAYIVLWTELNYGGVVVDNVGGTYPYRSNILFAGYIIEETRVVTGESNRQKFTEIRAATVDQVMREAKAYSVVQENVTSATRWEQIKDLTIQRGTVSLAKYRAFADMFDVHTGHYGDDKPIEWLDSPSGKLLDQFNNNYMNALAGKVGASLGGDLYCDAEHQTTPTASQWLTPALNIEQADLAGEVRVRAPVYPGTSLVTMTGVAGTTPLHSQSPGDLSGYFGGPQDQPPGMAPVNQSDLNEIAGKFLSSDAKPIETVTIPLAYGVNIDCNPQTLVNLTVSGIDDPRSDFFASGRDLILTGVRLEFKQDHTMKTSLVSEVVVENSIAGVTVHIPPKSDVNPGDRALPEWEYSEAMAVVPIPGEPIPSTQAGELLVHGDGPGAALTGDVASAIADGAVSYQSAGYGLPADGLIIDVTFLAGESKEYACVQSGSIHTAGIYERLFPWNLGSAWNLVYSEAQLRTIFPDAGYPDELLYHFGGIDFQGGYVFVNAGYSGVDSVIIDADATLEAGTNTGVVVAIGDPVVISADENDEWKVSNDVGVTHCNAEGLPQLGPAGPTALVPTALWGALVARIGTGDWFEIGLYNSFTADGNGELILNVNDISWIDNGGSLPVTISSSATVVNQRLYLVFDGSSWSLNPVYNTYSLSSESPGNFSAFGVSPNTAGEVYAPVYDGGDYKIAKSTDYAATFSVVGTVGDYVTAYNIPFENNPLDVTQWLGLEDGTVRRTINAGVTWPTITMPGGWSGNVSDQSIHSYTGDSDIMAIANENGQFATSQDGNNITPTFTIKASLAAAPYLVSGWPDDPLWFAVAGDTDVKISDDGAATWHSAVGDLSLLGFSTIRWVLPRWAI